MHEQGPTSKPRDARKPSSETAAHGAADDAYGWGYEAPDDALIAFRTRWLRLLFVRHGLAYVAIWGFLWGVLVLSGRMWQGELSMAWLVAGVGAIPALWLAWWRALSKLPADDAIRIWLDQHRGQGGLYMAQDEIDIGQWSRTVATAPLPKMQWRGGRYWALSLLALGFVLSAFLVPQKWFAVMASDRLRVDDQFHQLDKQLKTLQREKVLSKKQADAMKRQLKQLKRAARGSDPVQTLQGLEQLQQQQKDAAAQAAEQAAAQMDRWKQIQRMAKALAKHGDKMKSAERREAIKRLSRMIRKALGRASRLSRAQRQQLKSLMKQLQSGPQSGSQSGRGGQTRSIKGLQSSPGNRGASRGKRSVSSQGKGSKGARAGAMGKMSPQAARQMKRQLGQVGKIGAQATKGLGSKLAHMAKAGLIPKDHPRLPGAAAGQKGKPGRRSSGQNKAGKAGQKGKASGSKTGQKGAKGPSGSAGKSGKSGKRGQAGGANPGASGKRGKAQGKGQGARGHGGRGQSGGKGSAAARGGGAAPLTWKDATEIQGARFKRLALPRSKLKKLRRYVAGATSERRSPRGRRRRQPKVKHGALFGAKTSQSAAHTHAVAPQYWGTIKRYFTRGQRQPSPQKKDK